MEGGNFEDTVVDRRIILKWIFKKSFEGFGREWDRLGGSLVSAAMNLRIS
jgi:hypothetical protein